MKRFAVVLLVAVAVVFIAAPSHAYFSWSFDFGSDPTTEWDLTGLNWVLDPTTAPYTATIFAWDTTTAGPKIVTKDFLEYNPDPAGGANYSYNLRPASTGSPSGVQSSSLMFSVLGYDKNYALVDQISPFETKAPVQFWGGGYPLSEGSSIPAGGTISWSTVPRYIKLEYAIQSPVTGAAFVIDSVAYGVEPVPEPGTLLIGGMLVGLSGATLRRRAAKKSAQE